MRCPECDGSGKVTIYLGGYKDATESCLACDGTGSRCKTHCPQGHPLSGGAPLSGVQPHQGAAMVGAETCRTGEAMNLEREGQERLVLWVCRKCNLWTGSSSYEPSGKRQHLSDRGKKHTMDPIVVVPATEAAQWRQRALEMEGVLREIAGLPSVRLKGHGKDHHGEIVSVDEAVTLAKSAPIDSWVWTTRGEADPKWHHALASETHQYTPDMSEAQSPPYSPSTAASYRISTSRLCRSHEQGSAHHL